MTAVSYLPALRAGFIWDDDRYVTGNELLRSGDGLRRIWLEPSAFPQYYPLVLSSFWLERHAWGLNPRGYHLTNVALHAANAVLAWLLLRSLGVPGAWLAAAIFALHPVHVESVAWVTERKNLLSGFFALLSLRTYVGLESRDGVFGAGRAGGRRGVLLLCAAFAAFALALLSKTTACSVPAVLLVLLWWRRGAVSPGDGVRLAPFFAFGIFMGLVTVNMETTYVRATGPEWSFSFAERVLIAGRALWFYAAKLCWPSGLTFSYPRWAIDPARWWQHLYPLAAAAVAAALWSARRRLGRGPLAAALIFAGTLVPALGFFNTYPMRYSFVADHFQYLSSLALIALVPGLAARVLPDRLPDGAKGRAPALAAAAALLLALGTLTWNQTLVYRNAETLWRDTIRKNPGSWMAQTNLGFLLLGEGRVDDAARAFEASLRIKPDTPKALYGLGRVEAERGNLQDAVRLLRRSVEMFPGNEAARLTLANTLARSGDAAAARLLYLELLASGHSTAKVAGNLGALAAAREDWAEALHYFTLALEEDPHSALRQRNVEMARTEPRAAARRAAALDSAPALNIMRKIAQAKWQTARRRATMADVKRAGDRNLVRRLLPCVAAVLLVLPGVCLAQGLKLDTAKEKEADQLRQAEPALRAGLHRVPRREARPRAPPGRR